MTKSIELDLNQFSGAHKSGAKTMDASASEICSMLMCYGIIDSTIRLSQFIGEQTTLGGWKARNGEIFFRSGI
jgi:hypothetical protein